MPNLPQGSDLAAWLQAFAAIVALGISVWATLKPSVDEKRKERLRAYSIAVAIYPELLKLESVIAGATKSLERLKASDRVSINCVTGNLLSTQLDVPLMLERNIDNFYLLGDPAGATCIQLIGIIDQFNALVEAITSRIMILTAEQWQEALDHLKGHTTLVLAVLAKAEEAVRRLHVRANG